MLFQRGSDFYMLADGSETSSASLPEGVLTVSFEIGARIVVQAGGNGLGSMAKASIPVRVAWPSYVPPVW